MRKWGLIITLFYIVAVLALIVPGAVILMSDWSHDVAKLHANVKESYGYAVTWVCAGVLILGQVLLTGLTVDISNRRLKPRTHIAISAATTALLLAILVAGIVFSLAVARWGDDADRWIGNVTIVATFLVPWLFWGILFYRFSKDATDAITRAASWLLRGSILELLVAVPSHVIVRRRNDCCAPMVTGMGIAAGIAIMLLSFGPSVLLLYKKRIESLQSRGAAAAR